MDFQACDVTYGGSQQICVGYRFFDEIERSIWGDSLNAKDHFGANRTSISATVRAQHLKMCVRVRVCDFSKS